MRVAHVITRMIIGGAQENTLLCCGDLARDHGDDVLLVTGPALGPEGDLMRYVDEPGFPVEYVREMRRAIDPRRDVRAYRSLSGILRRFRPDVVHTHSAKAGMLGRVAAHRLGVPAIVHTVHGAPFHPYQSRGARALFRRCERFAARRCHAMISVADAMTELLVQAGVAPREKFRTIHSGMDVERFRIADQQRSPTRRRYDLTDDDFVIGKIARLMPLKGHDDLITAAGRVVRDLPRARFLVVGGGELRERLVERARREGLAEHFRFTGLVPPDGIAPLIGALDLLVHVSLREGLARCLPQALIAGKPVVAYDVDGAPEVVVPGVTGELVRPGDTSALARSITRLAGDPETRRRMGEQGRRLAPRFDHHEMTRRIRRLYLELIR